MINEQRFYNKLADWLGVDSLDNDNLSITTYRFNEGDYYQRIFLVTEMHEDDNMVDVYVVRMFVFDNENSLNVPTINLSVDYNEVMADYEFIKNCGDIFKIILDKMDR